MGCLDPQQKKCTAIHVIKIVPSDTARLKSQGHHLLLSVGSYPMVTEDCFGKLKFMLWSEVSSFQPAALRYSKDC